MSKYLKLEIDKRIDKIQNLEDENKKLRLHIWGLESKISSSVKICNLCGRAGSHFCTGTKSESDMDIYKTHRKESSHD
jgi:hypothetical protein